MKTVFLLLITSLLLLRTTAQSIEFNYVCPVPGSVYLNPSQVIILKTGFCFDPQSLKNCFAMVTGSQSGFIISKLSLSDDLKTLFVKPNNKFILGEKINVFISPGLRTAEGKNISSLNFDFFIKEKQISPIPMAMTSDGESDTPFPADLPGENRSLAARDNNLPPEYPAPTYVYTGPNAAPGYIFFTPTVRLTPQYDKYITIWDNYGTPIYYKKATKTVTDFRVLANGILTYAVNGMQNPENNCYYLMDGNYDVYDSVRAGYGYDIDNHDLLLLENGHYLILIYDPQIVNMSLIVPGGNPNAQVTGLVIQEVDLDRNVYFQWRSWDHFQITDATWDIDLTAYVIDYVHANALELDSDGHILVSCRHLDEVTKIDFNTGQIIWRWGLGSENNQFDFVNDQVGFSHQHDIRKLSNGNYTVYDNGNLHLTQVSRALEYHLDETAMTATMVWNYYHNPTIYAPLTGGNQRLQNNNRLIGWGGTSPIAITEVNQQNQVMLEFYLPDNVTGYRARKYVWQTTMFTMQNSLDFGNFNGSPDPKEYLLQVTNNYNQSIQISSAYNHEQDNFIAQGLPVTIPAGGTAEVQVLFIPDDEGTYNDILTLNYDNFNNTERIARQINLSGMWNPELPSIVFDPASGTEEIDPASEITATFSEPVRRIFNQVLEDDDVPNLFNFYTGNQDGEPVSFHGTVNEDRTMITIIPDEVLDEQQQYYLRLKPNVLEDLNGNVMNYSDFCFFTTGELVNLWENNSEAQLHIFPNPANGMLVVESPGAQIKKVELFTPDGRLLFAGSSPDGSIRINTRDFPAGLTAINVTVSTKGIEWHHSSKIVITR